MMCSQGYKSFEIMLLLSTYKKIKKRDSILISQNQKDKS